MTGCCLRWHGVWTAVTCGCRELNLGWPPLLVGLNVDWATGHLRWPTPTCGDPRLIIRFKILVLEVARRNQTCLIFFRAPRKTGKMVKSNSRRGKHKEFENYLIENLKSRKDAQKKLLCDVDCFVWCLKCCHFITKIHRENWNCTGKSQGILLSEMRGNHVI